MNNRNSNELLERLRIDIHAVADLICDVIELKLNSVQSSFPVAAEREKINEDTSGNGLDKERDGLGLWELSSRVDSGQMEQIKPNGIRLPNGKEINVRTWKCLAVAILQECASVPECRKKMMEEASAETTGHKRLLSSDPSMLYGPLKIAEGLYFNGMTTMRYLLKRLMNVLDTVGYDYSHIEVNVRPAMDRQRELPAQFADAIPLEQVYTYVLGRKPTLLTLPDGQEIQAGAWTDVIRELFKDCCKDPEHLSKLEEMDGQFITSAGNIFLSSDPDQMVRPIAISDRLYLDSSGTNEMAIRKTAQILDAVGYDCANVTLQIKDRRTAHELSEQQAASDYFEQEGDIAPTMFM